MKWSFELNDSQIQKLEEWKKKMFKKGVALQKEQYPDPDETMKFCWEEGFPYTGAIGGQFSFIFTPTSIGVAVQAKDALTGETLELTDYSDW